MMAEIKRLRDELKEMKRDQCQIALARKILNVADTQCVVCIFFLIRFKLIYFAICVFDRNVKIELRGNDSGRR